MQVKWLLSMTSMVVAADFRTSALLTDPAHLCRRHFMPEAAVTRRLRTTSAGVDGNVSARSGTPISFVFDMRTESARHMVLWI